MVFHPGHSVRLTHGDSIRGKWAPLYGVWNTMRQRCYNHNSHDYKHYGGRGIGICDEWSKYETFKQWANDAGYTQGKELDRINVDGNYTPKNCRWVPRFNNRNKRSNRYITAWGETKELAAWVEDNRCVVPYRTLKSRLDENISPETAMSTPARFSTAVRAKRLYCGGPMRGYERLNEDLFVLATKRLRARGYEVFSPWEKGIELEAINDMQKQSDLAFRRRVFALDTEIICKEMDAVVLLPGWEKSAGARAEYALAVALGLPVYSLGPEYTSIAGNHRAKTCKGEPHEPD